MDFKGMLQEMFKGISQKISLNGPFSIVSIYFFF